MESGLVSRFMEFTSCESQAYAVQHLCSCGWNLERAINIYFITGGVAGPSGVSTLLMPDEKDNDDHDDDVRAPIPARVEALYEDSYYGRRRGAAFDAQSIWEAPSPTPVPAVPVRAVSKSEVEATGWGEAKSGDEGEAGVENVSSQEAHDDAQEEDNNSEEEDYDLEMDEDDAYYDSLVEEGNSSNGREMDGEQPRPPQPQPEKKTLAELYRPPRELMYHGSFHDAKVHASRKDRFLLVNIQTEGEFASHLHNRDLWPDEVVSKVVKDNFVFLLLKGNYCGDECRKVCSFYKLEDDQLTSVLVLDPITGQLLAKRSGAIQPDEFMQFIDEYTKSKPSALPKPKVVQKTPTVPESSASTGARDEQEPAKPERSASAGATVEQEPAVPKSSASADACIEEEQESVPKIEAPAMMVDSDGPMDGEKMYKLRVRFPDGKVVAKEFGCKRRVAVLFAFCRSVVHDGGETEKKAFRIVRLAGRAFEEVQEDGATFEDLGLNCSTVSVVFNT
ncbi:putative plant UBX domain-containing protein 14 [Phragmites australis]|uniref:putative plant UBX domain-containing protein 14 n=1 Tax=Phragmites australis TaxID=29695 RepID=UPI002D771995|nr:putative plant UBX domain-containing protein 14 [Phragmites australis]